MPLADNYWLQDLFSRAYGSTAESLDSTTSLELSKYHNYGETYVLAMNEKNYTPLPYMIDVYNRCQQRKVPSIASHEWKLYHPEDADKYLQQDGTIFECGTGSPVGCYPRLELKEQRNWGLRLGSGGNESIEFWNSGLEESNQSGVSVFCFFSSLLFSILCYFRSRPSTNGIGTVFYRLQLEVELACATDPPHGHPERYWVVVGLVGSYNCIHRMVVSFWVSILIASPYIITSSISAQCKWCWHRYSPPPDCSQAEVEFHRVPDPPRSYCTVPISSTTFELFEYVPSIIVQFILSVWKGMYASVWPHRHTCGNYLNTVANMEASDIRYWCIVRLSLGI